MALVELERRARGFTLITQNVDGLHQRAGSSCVLEVHGSIWTLRCTRCERKWLDLRVPLPTPPRCECGALARPGVVWFGEGLPEDVWAAADQAAVTCDVLLAIGTSAVVHPAAGLVNRAQSAGAKVIEVNAEETTISGVVDCALTGRAGEILPMLVEATHGT
jgi:NAD-dependent deacetylase